MSQPAYREIQAHAETGGEATRRMEFVNETKVEGLTSVSFLRVELPAVVVKAIMRRPAMARQTSRPGAGQAHGPGHVYR